MPKLLLIFLITLSAINLSGQNDGIIASYLFEEGSLEDVVGKRVAKAYDLSLVEDRFGNPRSAYYFQGNQGSYLNLGSGKDLKLKKASISLWVNIYGIMAKGFGVESSPIMFTRANHSEDCNEAIYIGFDLNIRKFGGATMLSEKKGVSIYSKKPAALATWYHLVLTYDDDFLCFYENGKLQYKSAKKFESSFLEGDSILVGTRVSEKNTRFLFGCIDDIEIYNKVLSPGEVKALYNSPNPNGSRIIFRWIIIGVAVLIFILIIIFLIKRRIKLLINLEKEKNQLRNHWYEQENKVLTAQMDPHFIFNSLNTIQQFIITNENEKAQLYLTKFSRLMRKILESNSKDKYSLKEEIDIIEKYLEIESLRFNNVFDYKIILKNEINPETTFIPHFLMQPLVENAVWHGLLPKEGSKELIITFEKIDEKALTCIVDDNGVGRKKNKVQENYDKKRSFAINFIEQRLLLMSKMKNYPYGIDIFDKSGKEGMGTRVIISMPIYIYDEPTSNYN